MEKEIHNDRKLWANYIRAQRKLVDRNNRPVRLLPIKTNIDINGVLSVEVDLSDGENRLELLIRDKFSKAIFPSNKQCFLLEHLPSDASTILEELSATLLRWHIRLEPRPVLQATIRERKDWLKTFLGSLENAGCRPRQASDGDWLLTQYDLKIVDNILTYSGLTRRKRIGAVFALGGGSRVVSQAQVVRTELEKMGVKPELIQMDARARVVRISDGDLSKKALQASGLAHVLRIKHWVVRYTVQIDKLSDPNQNFPYRDRFPATGDLWEHKFMVPGNDLEVLDFTRILFEKYFGEDGFSAEIFESEYVYPQLHPIFNEIPFPETPDDTWELLFNTLDPEVYKVNPIRKTVSFDFEHFGKNDFGKKYERLRSIEEIDWMDYENIHRYKVKIFPSSFETISLNLKQDFPDLETEVTIDGATLQVRLFYEINTDEQRLDFWNALSALQNQGFEVLFPDRFHTRFDFEIDETTLALEENIRWRNLRGVEFSIQGETLGTIGKVDFPRLQLRILPEKVAELRERLKQDASFICQITPNLRGDLEKLHRLELAVRQVFGNTGKLPNPNTARFLFNSAEARTSSILPDSFRKNSPEWKRIAARLRLPLNDSQFLAVLKTLHAPELALVQGPPGTGKSTAIAEIIRQHLLDGKATRILLTSETHLAVDNAIVKLIAIPDGIVRPIRFGDQEQLEDEGARYALFRIQEWMETEIIQEQQTDNVAFHWLQRIATCAESQQGPESEFLRMWAAALRSPDKGLRYVFGRAYLDHINVIGTTGSSLGILNTKGNPTPFLRQYESIFDRENAKLKKHKRAAPDVQFDLVVMDEASKATPPEIALPMLFAKKAIIVGDHRQLPPMLDEEDFAESLEWLGASELAEAFRQTNIQQSHFEKLFCNPHLANTLRASFREQYRMHPAINEVIAQFYEADEGLSCALQTPDDPDFNNPQSRWHGLFASDFLTPDTHVVWLNVSTPEIVDGTSRRNPGEVEACDWVLQKLKDAKGFTEFQKFWPKSEDKEIGIISFYKSQVRALETMTKQKHHDLPARVRPVDRFQGMERNIIIVSLVRSNTFASSTSQKPDFTRYPGDGYPKQTSIGFAEFPNRLNVALSRAKRLLIIVGNATHFASKRVMYRRVLNAIHQHPQGKVIDFKTLLKKYVDS